MIAGLVGGLLFPGCALKPKFIAPNYGPPSTVAVLPFNNHTIDMDGPVLVRRVFSEKLRRRGYNVKPEEETDDILRKQGITDGGQLPSIKPAKLAEVLGVDGLFYGDLIEFKYVTLGFYNTRVVEANFKLIDGYTGEMLWEDQRKATKTKIALSSEDALEVFKDKLVEKTVDKMLRMPLKEETDLVIKRVISTLPYGR
ncbi:MAG: DUF799 family lipoprotein [Elusimicrobia bacterium]|nr:DUF799 family lipoprotein [Elusimicrobiota bacterium]